MGRILTLPPERRPPTRRHCTSPKKTPCRRPALRHTIFPFVAVSRCARGDGAMGNCGGGVMGQWSVSTRCGRGRGATAIELRSADFSPLPRRPGETAGGGLKSALLLGRTAPNSTAVGRGALWFAIETSRSDGSQPNAPLTHFPNAPFTSPPPRVVRLRRGAFRTACFSQSPGSAWRTCNGFSPIAL